MPQEGADFHIVARGGYGLVGIGVHAHDFAGAELVFVIVIELVVREGFEGNAVALFVLANQDGEAADFVACCDDVAFIGHDKQGERSVDGLLGELDAFDEAVFLVDEGSNELGVVHLARAHGHELLSAGGEAFLDELLRVIDDAYRGDAESAEMRAHQKRLRVGVADAADAAASVEALQVVFEFRSKRRVFNRMDFALESGFGVEEDHACATCSQVGVIVDAEEHIKNHIVMGCSPEESAHGVPFVIG